ncbi:MAG: hypothetical protein II807_09335 [Thermoguttaceae bacterium]|nr:hypothetical protein [Thermoguttaceae bacterium]
MTMEWKKCHINVPLNNKGVAERASSNGDMPNVVSYTLSSDEYYLLENVFNEWNRQFDLLIDIFEEETLEPRFCQEALEILERRAALSDGAEFLAAAEKLRKALETAIKTKMSVYLDF